MSAEELARQAADRVREVIADAERRAEEIVAAAEREAAEIRGRAEAGAEERIARARQALDVAGGARQAPLTAEAQRALDAEPPEDAAPAVPTAPAAPAPNGGSADAAERLLAMKLALEGQGRDQIAAELEGRYGPGDRAALIDDVLARAGKR